MQSKKNKGKAKSIDLSKEFGFSNASTLPLTAAEREAKKQEELKKAKESDPSLTAETDYLT